MIIAYLRLLALHTHTIARPLPLAETDIPRPPPLVETMVTESLPLRDMSAHLLALTLFDPSIDHLPHVNMMKGGLLAAAHIETLGIPATLGILAILEMPEILVIHATLEILVRDSRLVPTVNTEMNIEVVGDIPRRRLPLLVQLPTHPLGTGIRVMLLVMLHVKLLVILLVRLLSVLKPPRQPRVNLGVADPERVVLQ